jgi:hypothetical protein
MSAAGRLLRFAAAAAVALGAGFGGKLMMEAVARQMLYPVPPFRVPSPPPRPFVEVPLAAEGRALSAWWLPPPEGQGSAVAARGGAPLPVVLMLHGNGENLETMRQSGLFEDYRRAGAGVLALDYPGYGRSAGTPSEAANVAAAGAAFDWLRGQAGGRPVVVAGWSLGAAVAAQVAARRPDEVAAVMLLSPWDRLDEVARLHFPGWMVSAMLAERYDSAAVAPRIAAPALVVHGERDEIIPATLGRRLFDALPGPKRWVEVRGAGHNDLLGRPEAWQAIASFLEERAAHPG